MSVFWVLPFFKDLLCCCLLSVVDVQLKFDFHFPTYLRKCNLHKHLLQINDSTKLYPLTMKLTVLQKEK